ncbi:DUF3196 family protein [Sporosarcina siberiensis]|uniref:DUF3196 family protein n=1 Tax=Sporosarcina siberiensis TaxID=1365606 RepID=A0ABW4SD26_9BACL
MHRKHGRLRKKENIIVFPGTFEKLVYNGTTFVEAENYDAAVEAFDQAILYEPEYPEFLIPYAIALYETKDFVRAKDIAARILHVGTANYIEAMELYLTISIQLQEYEEVEITIDALLDEGIIPEEMLSKFNYLRDLNTRLAKRYGNDVDELIEPPFTMKEFKAMDSLKQQHTLASLEGSNLNALVPVLEEVAKDSTLSPLVITFALTLLHQAGCTSELTIEKFGLKAVIIPAEITLPGQDDQTKEVLSEVERLLLKDPSRFEMASGIIEKFAITAFPFSWGTYDVKEIASTYIEYIESLFSGGLLPNNPLISLIKRIDTDSDWEVE